MYEANCFLKMFPDTRNSCGGFNTYIKKTSLTRVQSRLWSTTHCPSNCKISDKGKDLTLNFCGSVYLAYQVFIFVKKHLSNRFAVLLHFLLTQMFDAGKTKTKSKTPTKTHQG